MYSCEELVEIFEETNKIDKYDHLLETKVYTEEELNSINLKVLKPNECCTCSYNDTVSEILDTDGYMAVLNFADGCLPGGYVNAGSKAQEETLCRVSNLYKSLTLPICQKEFYEYNKSNPEFSNGKSSDRIIYTRNVVVFKDTDYVDLMDCEVKTCDIITCPAPLVDTASDSEIIHRMKNIIKVADYNRVSTLILGCWGCGAFGNDWKHFTKLWRIAIKSVDKNCKIVMATRGKDFFLEDIYFD